jgi:hypothetical protein
MSCRQQRGCLQPARTASACCNSLEAHRRRKGILELVNWNRTSCSQWKNMPQRSISMQKLPARKSHAALPPSTGERDELSGRCKALSPTTVISKTPSPRASLVDAIGSARRVWKRSRPKSGRLKFVSLLPCSQGVIGQPRICWSETSLSTKHWWLPRQYPSPLPRHSYLLRNEQSLAFLDVATSGDEDLRDTNLLIVFRHPSFSVHMLRFHVSS